jgi:hypothetical protein
MKMLPIRKPGMVALNLDPPDMEVRTKSRNLGETRPGVATYLGRWPRLSTRSNTLPRIITLSIRCPSMAASTKVVVRGMTVSMTEIRRSGGPDTCPKDRLDLELEVEIWAPAMLVTGWIS